MKMKINRPVGATRQRNTASIRRTVLYTAVVAAVGLFLAGLPVAGTTPTAQAQTTEWHQIDQPYLSVYVNGNRQAVDRNQSTAALRRLAWYRVSDGGWNGGSYFYTYGINGDPRPENVASWNMGSLGEWRGPKKTYEFQVYIPVGIGDDGLRKPSTASVVYTIRDDDGARFARVDQSRHQGSWVTLTPTAGSIPFDFDTLAGSIVVTVADTDAEQHWSRDGHENSRIGIDAVRMRCVSNCGTAPSTTTPPTTTPPSSTPKISGLTNELTPFVDHFPLSGFLPDPVGGSAQDRFQVSPSSADVTATVAGSVSGLKAVIDKSGESAILTVTTNGRVDFVDSARYRIVVTARDGSRSVTTRNVYVTVVKPKYRVKEEGFHKNKRLIAQRTFTTVDGTRVLSNSKGGVVKHQSSNLSHFGNSWIAEDAKVWDSGVRVLGNALVKGRVELRGRAKVSGNARVIGPSLPDRRTAKVYDNALVTGTAQVIGPVEVTRNAKVFGNARVIGNAQVTNNAEVSGNTWVYSLLRVRAQVFKNAKVFGNAHVAGNAKVSGDAHVAGNARVYSLQTDKSYTASVYGRAKVYGSAKVLNGAKVHNSARICGDAEVRDTPPGQGRRQIASVSGDAQVSGRTILTSGDHRSGARYGGGCPDPTPTPPRAPQN